MSTAYLGEIRIVSFNFAPRGWAICNGQVLAIAQNQALFSLLGATFGGDGQRTFALPNFPGREPLHRSISAGVQPYNMGEMGGEATHKLTGTEMPSHTHTPVSGTSDAPSAAPFTNNLWAAATVNHYTTADAASKTAMSAAAIASIGGSQGHENMPPFLVLNFIIALQGIYPSRN